MRNREIRGERSRSRSRRSGRSGIWLLLLTLFGLGFAAALGGRRRGAGDWEDEDADREEPVGRARASREAFHRTAAAEPHVDGPEPAMPADFAEPDPEAVWIAGPAGNLYVRDGGPGSDSGTGRLPVLFVHSLGGNGGQWALQLDHLRRERRAAALDLRGHGDSDPADDGDYSIEALAGDVAAAADQLDLRHFVLAGHSLGSLVAIEYAGRHPARVAGLLLVDPNGDQTQVPAAEIESFLAPIRNNPLVEMDWYFRQLVAGGDSEVARWVLEDLALTDESALLGSLEGATRYSPLPALARYAGPKVAIVSDMNDHPTSLHRLVPELPAHWLGGTGHWLQMDRPEPFNRLMDEFLVEIEGGER